MTKRANRRFVSETDPDYPHARYKKGGKVTIAFEIIHDGNGEYLAEDAGTVARRYLEERGVDVDGWDLQYQPDGMWLTEEQIKSRP